LADLLSASSPQSPLLHVLRPLVVSGVDEVRQWASQWAAEIRESKVLTAAAQVRLLDLLTTLIVQRFSQMTREEIDKMLQLTPLEQTRAGQELIEQGVEQGIEQGEVNILTRQIVRKFDVSEEVVEATLRRLRRRDLEELSDFVLEAESFAQIRAWLDRRTSSANGN
jgi:predicted transposase YdaD